MGLLMFVPLSIFFNFSLPNSTDGTNFTISLPAVSHLRAASHLHSLFSISLVLH